MYLHSIVFQPLAFTFISTHTQTVRIKFFKREKKSMNLKATWREEERLPAILSL